MRHSVGNSPGLSVDTVDDVSEKKARERGSTTHALPVIKTSPRGDDPQLLRGVPAPLDAIRTHARTAKKTQQGTSGRSHPRTERSGKGEFPSRTQQPEKSAATTGAGPVRAQNGKRTQGTKIRVAWRGRALLCTTNRHSGRSSTTRAAQPGNGCWPPLGPPGEAREGERERRGRVSLWRGRRPCDRPRLGREPPPLFEQIPLLRFFEHNRGRPVERREEHKSPAYVDSCWLLCGRAC